MMAAKPYYRSLSLLIGLNLLVKPLWILGIDRPVQNIVGHEAYGTYFALFNLTLILNILLDMGITAGHRIRSFRKGGIFLYAFGIIAPVVNAALAIFLSHVLGISPGNAFLLAILASSASYIAVPAALRLAIPESDPGLYIPMALAVTFPFNIVLGIPLYFWMSQAF